MDRQRAARLIQEFDFAGLFADQLFWNRLRGTILVEVDGQDLLLQSIAEKKAGAGAAVPPRH